jgi:molybdopterin converting factor small subunit
MQEISPNRFAGIIETNDALIIGVRGFVRSLVLRQADVTTSHSTRLSKDESQVAGYQHERPFNLFHAGLSNFLGRINKTLSLSPATSLASRQEVAIMYFGRTSEFLMMTSERMVIPTGRYTLGQLLSSLYKRGDRWVDELDESHLLCTVNGRDARLFDPIAPGAEICISSRKSIFEA